MPSFRRPACLVLVLLACGAAGLRAQTTSVRQTTAVHQTTAVRFDIPRQRADIALTRFAQQAGIPVLFPYDTVSKRTANPLSGEYPISDGLKILLDGTGLVAHERLRPTDHSSHA